MKKYKIGFLTADNDQYEGREPQSDIYDSDSIPYSNEDISSFEYISEKQINQNYVAAIGYEPITQELDDVLMDYILICKRYNLLLAKYRKEI